MSDENWPFDQLFGPVEKIFAEFDRLFQNGVPPSSSNDLRSEVLKDEEEFSSSSSWMNRVERQLTPSGKCFLETRIQQSTDQPDREETISKICGEKYHTTVKINGQISREYGNATREQLDQIDSSSSPPTDFV